MKTKTLEPTVNVGTTPQPLKMIGYESGMQRLRELIDLIHGKIALGNSTLIGKNFGFLKVLSITLEAQRQLLGHLNDSLIYCPLAWDETTGFPSHPTLVADLQNYIEIFKLQDAVLATVLRSFAHWELLVQETSVRCCGSNFKLKTVKMDIKLNHILKTADGWLGLKQLVGVESADLSHQELQNYFDFRRPSKVIDGLMIIFSREWLLLAKNGQLETSEVKTEKAELFNLEKFQNIIDSLNIP
ncbi:MAG: hypothetical protein HYX20_00675 [Candidatus Yanofskybacteria bacterium]|nr:hypothetical protein [Candidatus Yanofskybacteria bacterium]